MSEKGAPRDLLNQALVKIVREGSAARVRLEEVFDGSSELSENKKHELVRAWDMGQEAMEMLLYANAPLMRTIVRTKFKTSYCSFDDLQSWGTNGLLQAVSAVERGTFDPDKARFSTYAHTCITNAVNEGLSNVRFADRHGDVKPMREFGYVFGKAQQLVPPRSLKFEELKAYPSTVVAQLKEIADKLCRVPQTAEDEASEQQQKQEWRKRQEEVVLSRYISWLESYDVETTSSFDARIGVCAAILGMPKEEARRLYDATQRGVKSLSAPLDSEDDSSASHQDMIDDPEAWDDVARAYERSVLLEGLDQLSEDEREVAEYRSKGYEIGEIAEEFFVERSEIEAMERAGLSKLRRHFNKRGLTGNGM